MSIVARMEEQRQPKTPIKVQGTTMNNKRLAYDELETPLRELTQANFILTASAPKVAASESPLFIKRLRIDSEPILDDEEGFELVLPEDTLIDSPCAHRFSLRGGKPSSLDYFTPVKSFNRISSISDLFNRNSESFGDDSSDRSLPTSLRKCNSLNLHAPDANQFSGLSRENTPCTRRQSNIFYIDSSNLSPTHDLQSSQEFLDDSSIESPCMKRNSPNDLYVSGGKLPRLTPSAPPQPDFFDADSTNIFLSSGYNDVQSSSVPMKGSLTEFPRPNQSVAYKENIGSRAVHSSKGQNTVNVTPTEKTPNRTRDKNTSSPEICNSTWISRRRTDYVSTPVMLRKMANIMQPSPAMVNEYTTKYAHMLDESYFKDVGRNSRIFCPPKASGSQYKDYFTDNFIVDSVLGIGEFSTAYKVNDRKTGALYAVKKAKTPFKSHTARAERLEEVEIMWKLGKHPNCLQLFSAWEQRGHLYLQTELCENRSLEYFLKYNSKLEEPKIWRIFADIAFGLEHIHKCDIMHLDLKPGNIFQTLDGIFKIGDFGLSASWPAKPDLDRQGDCRYISLEALNCHYDKSADIYSLGTIVLEMTGIISLSKKTADKIRLGDLSELEFERISGEMSTLLKAMLHVNHKERPKIQKIVKIPKIRSHRGVQTFFSHQKLLI
ncbi:13824_t:CDS:1 [Acaulospora morrowiae]|uniref:13824_t:CDS:1 n=1 Tax=Acaulospora morrowiae TaxID=94023 RepID=A0A9N9FAJ0_9GLOM|nr:13824_t:CDS:1 [Acaulospora morrowiae]